MDSTVAISFVLLFSSANVTNGKLEHCSHKSKYANHAVCSLFPESMEGPFYVEDQHIRQNITEGKPGVPVELSVIVVNFTTCDPLLNVPVDIWQCDAFGEYSNFIGVTLDPSAIGTEGEEDYQGTPMDNKTYLRGVQYTNQEGQVTFHTLFPGWYPGRTIHIHVMAHVNNIKHTGQLYFEQKLQDDIARKEPYLFNFNTRTRNAQDFIYNMADGAATTLRLVDVGGGFKTSILMGFRN